jgi:hypothetical protein
MNKILRLLPILLIVMLAVSCIDDGHELGRLLDKSEIDIDVVQDYSVDVGGNTVYLKNNTAGTVSMWDYGTGRSSRVLDTVRFPFKGQYTIKFSALTGGGVVALDPIVINVTEDNFEYVTDPLWKLLTGGVGEEKTWLLDANENLESKHFTSPVYFSGDQNANSSWDGTSLSWTKVCAIPGGPDPVCFTYEPNYKSDTWVAGAADYGFMTFNLIGGPFVNTDHKGISGKGVESGTFFLDPATRTLTMTDATPLANEWGPNDAGTMNTMRILSLSENFMQLAVHHKSKTEYLIFNYISKEYSDNWVPEEPEEPQPDEGYNPTFEPGELLAMLAGGPTNSGRFWELDANGNPVDWIKAGIGWTTGPGSSNDWGWNASWISAIQNSWIRFDTYGGQNYSRFQNGVLTTGTFTINESTNEVTLVGGKLLQNDGHWMNPSATTLKVVKGFPDSYQTKGIWFGTGYDASKDEWLSFHYIISN